MPTLYVVTTPIGNLEDITLRALRVLGEVGLIAAEDTRVTKKLLARYEIPTPITSYHEHNRATKIPRLLAALEEKDVALVSDAGVPGLSDPGAELVAAAAEAGVRVVPVPGPSALTAAISVSGFVADGLVYLGFLPRKRGQRSKLLVGLRDERRPLVAFEAPHRLRASLDDISDALGDRRVVVCRELTKLHEEVFRGTVSEAIAHFTEPRGEFVLVLEGSGQSAEAPEQALKNAAEMLGRMFSEGAGSKEAVAIAAKEHGISRREAYRLWLASKD